MVQNYVTLSLETHLFFSRIMKEHALFLEAGFPCQNSDWMQKADHYREQFEELLMDVVKMSNGRVNNPILNSDELVTEFTIAAEEQTECLCGVSINTELSKMTKNLRSEARREMSRELVQMVHQTNERCIRLLNGLINFKEDILREVSAGNLFTFNYPLLIEHILREAKLYRSTVDNLMHNRQVTYKELLGTEDFWNQIMMEHALFIRGLLDPDEDELVRTAHEFAMDYKKLLETAKKQDYKAIQGFSGFSNESLQKTLEYHDFKATGTQGILNREIDSVILPLLADHVLREANHYIRISKCANMRDCM